MFVTIAWEDADGGLGIGGFEDGLTEGFIKGSLGGVGWGVRWQRSDDTTLHPRLG